MAMHRKESPQQNTTSPIYPHLSYQVVGILFDVYNELGYGLREKQYERAVAVGLEDASIQFIQQAHVPLFYQDKKIGDYYLDFLIENKVALELKQGAVLPKKNIEQVYSYLKALDLKLGIIAQFTPQGLKYKRVLNIE